MFCPNCQAELADQAKFCTKCGTSLAATPVMSTPTMQNETPVSTTATAETTEAAGFMSNLTPKKKGLLAGVGSVVAIALVAIIAVSVIAPGGALAVDENNFPDDTFRAYVSDKIDTDKNGKLSKKEIDAVTSIDISAKAKDAAKVNDLTGIGHFHGLKSLNASHNHLHCVPADFHRCRYVKYVDLSHNEINQTVNIERNTYIVWINLGDNPGEKGDGNVDVVVPSEPEEEQNIVASDPAPGDEVVGGKTYEELFPVEPTVDPDNPEGAAGDNSAESAETDSAGSATTGDESATTSEQPSESNGAAAAKSSSGKLFAAKDDSGKWGYIDEAGAVAIDFQYSDAGSFSGDAAPVKNGSDFTVIKRDGSEVKGVSGKTILPYSEGYAYVANGSGSASGLAGGTMVEAPGKFVDVNGKDLGVSGLTGGGEFHAGYAPAKTSSGWGFVSTSGSWAINGKYSAVTSVASVNGKPIAGVCEGGTWTYIDVSTGQKAFDGEFTEASAFDSTGHAVAKHKASSSSDNSSKASAEPGDFVTTNGRYMPGEDQLATVADNADEESDGSLSDEADEDVDNNASDEAEKLAAEEEAQRLAEEEKARQEEEERKKKEEEEKDKVVTDKYVVIDGSGNDTGVIEQSTVGQMYEGLAGVNSGGSWGFVGTNGSLAIDCKFKAVGRFNSGFAPAQDSSGKWGIINTSGAWVVQPTYAEMQSLGAL